MTPLGTGDVSREWRIWNALSICGCQDV